MFICIVRNIASEKGVMRAFRFALVGFSYVLKGRRLPHTTEMNLTLWSHYDWSDGGDEWSKSPEWVESVVEHIMKPNVPIGSCVLEIGPGAGRWTEYLLKRAGHVVVVDLVPKCIEICTKRFDGFNNIEYFINDGTDLGFISANSIDCVWSWDVFVHIQCSDVERYIRQCSTFLAPGGRGVIHHANGWPGKGWMSDITAEKVATYCGGFELDVIQQFRSWNDGRDEAPGTCDIVTIFGKPISSEKPRSG